MNPLGLHVRRSLGLVYDSNSKGGNTPKHHGSHHYCVLYKEEVMHKINYMLHNYEDCFVKRSKQKSIKNGLAGPLGSRADDVKQYKNFEHK